MVIITDLSLNKVQTLLKTITKFNNNNKNKTYCNV